MLRIGKTCGALSALKSLMSIEMYLSKCPNCAELVQPEAIICRFCNRGLSQEHFKKCRLCGEMIRPAAKKCRSCLSFLSQPPPIDPPAGAPVPRQPIYPLRSSEVALALSIPLRMADGVSNVWLNTIKEESDKDT